MMPILQFQIQFEHNMDLNDFGFFTTTQDSYIQTLADKLNQTATQRGYSSYDEVNFVLAFVQSIPYKTDNAQHRISRLSKISS